MRKVTQWLARPDWWTAVFSGVLALTAIGALWYARDTIKETRDIAGAQLEHAHSETEAQLKQAHQADQIQHLLELVREFDQEPMATYRKRLAYKRLNTKEDDPLELYRVLDFFETGGRLVD